MAVTRHLELIMPETLLPVSGSHLSELKVCRLYRDASLPRSADDEGEEGDDEDDDDDEAAAVRPAAVDSALPLIPEFPVVAHFVRSLFQRAALPMKSQMPSRAAGYHGPIRA